MGRRDEETSSERMAQRLDVKIEKILIKMESLATKEDLRSSQEDHRREYHSAKTMTPAGSGMFSPKMLTVLLGVIAALGIAVATLVSSSCGTDDQDLEANATKTNPIQ